MGRVAPIVFVLMLALQACERDEVVCGKDYDALIAQELSDIESGENILRRIIQGDLAEDDATPEEIAAVERMEAILDSHDRPVAAEDLQILEGAAVKLNDPAIWDRADDRECGEEDETISLFCALYFSSIDVLGEYEHRRTALQEVRYAIEDLRPGVEYEHRLMDFNNAGNTTFEDIHAVLSNAAQKVRDRLEQQARCAL